MADSIGGNGLIQAERALATLVEHPERLNRARWRFSASPPSYTSPPPEDTTEPPTPGDPDARRVEQAEQREIAKHEASKPYNQIGAQEMELRERINKEERLGIHRVPNFKPYDEYTFEAIKRSWEEQGIWNKRWDRTPFCKRVFWRWKHEEPLESGCESDSDADAEDDSAYQLFSRTIPSKRKRKAPLSDEQRARLEHDREASRPIHQFLWQMSKERDVIRGEATLGEAATTADLDINTQAYKNIKALWEKRNIWDIKWGIMPGMSWKHERPREQGFQADSVPTQSQEAVVDTADIRAETPRSFSKPPTPPIPQNRLPNGSAEEGTLSGHMRSFGDARRPLPTIFATTNDERETVQPVSGELTPVLPDWLRASQDLYG
ncbi:MAG: hypothetical protein Q9166_007118 [cf. Caloplaca sp. 2 TL-2023]